MRKLADLVHLEALSYTILPKLQTKILGYIVSNDLSHDTYINQITTKINYRTFIPHRHTVIPGALQIFLPTQEYLQIR